MCARVKIYCVHLRIRKYHNSLNLFDKFSFHKILCKIFLGWSLECSLLYLFIRDNIFRVKIFSDKHTIRKIRNYFYNEINRNYSTSNYFCGNNVWGEIFNKIDN